MKEVYVEEIHIVGDDEEDEERNKGSYTIERIPNHELNGEPTLEGKNIVQSSESSIDIDSAVEGWERNNLEIGARKIPRKVHDCTVEGESLLQLR